MTTMTGFVERAIAVIREAQRDMLDQPRVEEEERWGAALQLIGASIEDDTLIVRFTEPDGPRINYRWRVRREDEGYNAFTEPDEALYNLSWNFHEDVECLDLSEPDADGVRWFGDDD